MDSLLRWLVYDFRVALLVAVALGVVLVALACGYAALVWNFNRRQP